MFNGRTRPLGVTIIGALLLVGAIFGLCGGVFKLIGSPLNILQFDISGLFVDSFTAIVAIVLSLANIALAFGLFGLVRWAYWVTLIVQGLHVLNGLRVGNGLIFGAGIIPVIIVIYLLVDGNVRRAFRV